jgi:hypothetical protein
MQIGAVDITYADGKYLGGSAGTTLHRRGRG